MFFNFWFCLKLLNNDTNINTDSKRYSSNINELERHNEEQNNNSQTYNKELDAEELTRGDVGFDVKLFAEQPVRGPVGFDLILFTSKIEIYLIGNPRSGSGGLIFRTVQSQPNGGFAPWKKIGTPSMRFASVYPSVGIDSQHTSHMAAVSSTGIRNRLQIFSETAANNMEPVKTYPHESDPGYDPKIVTNKNGKLELFYVSGNGNLYHGAQDNSLKWPDSLNRLDGGYNSSPTIVMDRDKNLNLFAVSGQRLWHARQNDNLTWPEADKFENLGGSVIGNPVAGVNEGGRIEVFVSGINKDLQSITQKNNGTWPDEWDTFGGRFSQDPAVGRNKDGRLEVFVAGGGLQIYHIYQTAPNNGWTGWNRFIRRNEGSVLDDYWSGGNPSFHYIVTVHDKRGKIKLINNADGRFSAFALGDDSLYHAYQTSPSNGWNDYPWKHMYGHGGWPPA